MLHELNPENITGIDLNYPYGKVVPAMVNVGAFVFVLYGVDANDVEVMANYVRVDLHDHAAMHATYLDDVRDSAAPLPLDKVYALQTAQMAGECDTAEFRGLNFVNGGSMKHDGTRWNRR